MKRETKRSARHDTRWPYTTVIRAEEAGESSLKRREHIVAPQQHGGERASALDQAFAAGRRDHQFDQLVDDGVLDAGVVAAGSFVGCRAAPILALLVSRRERLCRRDDHHVEVQRAQALDVLRGVDKAGPALTAEAGATDTAGTEQHPLAIKG